MDPDLANIIRQALADAKAAGKDYLSQTEEAIRTVRSFSWFDRSDYLLSWI